MTVEGIQGDRNVIPRWREFARTASSGELGSLEETGLRQIDDVAFDRKVYRWGSRRSIPLAVDLCRSAFVLGRTDEDVIKEAAEYVVESDVGLRSPMREIVGQLVEEDEQEVVGNEIGEGEVDFEDRARQRIGRLRNRLRSDPHDVIARVDLAREHSVTGNLEKATSQIETALSLERSNRFVVRAAARLFVHKRQPERANYILRKTDGGEEDPWLVAPEIASAGMVGRRPSFLRTGRTMADSDKLSAYSVTEVRSALGTRRYREGDWRRARQRIRQSLNKPNDNTVAQAEWASEEMSGIGVSERELDVPRTYEARARRGYRSDEYELAVEECRRWFLDEPYSRRPVHFGTFILGGVLEEYGRAAELARQGLRANRGDNTLLNNLAFSLISNGQADHGLEVLDRINYTELSAAQEVAVTATRGLAEFRLENPKIGRQLYRQAIDQADVRDMTVLRALAEYHLAVEEVRLGTERMREAVESAAISAAGDETEEVYPFLRDKIGELMDNMTGR